MPSLAAIEKRLRSICLGYPEAVEEFPWGDRVFKVRKKIFAFATLVDRVLYVTVKLPETGAMALSLGFTEPTGYGLGRAGWVTATFQRARDVPVDLLVEWIDESYRAVAPKRLATARAAASGGPSAAAPARHRAARRPAPRDRGSASDRGAARARGGRASKRSGGGSART